VPAFNTNQIVAMFQAGRHAELETLVCALLEQHPRSGFLWKALGAALQVQGKEALDALRQASVLLPNDAQAHSNLGAALRDAGQLEAALKSYRRALMLKPDLADIHNNLGIALLDLERLADAEASFRRALKIDPRHSQAHNNLGNALQAGGKLEDAVACYRQALELAPDYADAHRNMGVALYELGSYEAAATSLQHAIALKPGFAQAHFHLGLAQKQRDQAAKAEASFRNALEIDVGFVEAHVCLGQLLKSEGRSAEAQACCQAALALDSGAAATVLFAADLLTDQGKFAEAEQSYLRAAALDKTLTAAWAGVAKTRKMTKADAAWLETVRTLAASDLPPRAETVLRYALGKYFNDVGDFSQAFSQYRQANELTKLYGKKYDRAGEEQVTDRLSRTYGKDWFARERHLTNPSNRPVFIIGMPRSGTSLAEQILAAHPQVYGAGELDYWRKAVLAHKANALDGADGDAVLSHMADDYSTLLRGRSPCALRVVDKMPSNFASLGLILAAFPHARIIHLQRNPIDTCLSIYFQHFNTNHSYANDLGDIAHYYVQYFRLMQHWRAVLPAGSMLEVPYEALVGDQEGWSRKMIDFIGLPWDTRCLDFHTCARTVGTASNWQVRQKIDKSSVERWRNYAAYVGPLFHLLELWRPRQPQTKADTVLDGIFQPLRATSDQDSGLRSSPPKLHLRRRGDLPYTAAK